jgi:branched-chain amino acid transport system substrate-binding protein
MALVSAACGTRVSHSRIVAGARGSVIVPEAAGSTGGSDAGGVADGEAAAAGTPGGEAAAGASATGAGTVGGTGSQPAATADAGGDASGTAAGQARGTPVVLGNVGDYDGIPGSVLGTAPSVLQVWAKWVNAHGGLNGHPVQVISGNAGGDPAKNLSIVRTMVEQNHVVAFIANQVPLSVKGSLDYLEQKQIPVIGGDEVTHIWQESPMLFPQGTDINDLVISAIKIAVRQAAPKIGLIYCAEAAFVCQNVHHILVDERGIQKAGGTLVYDAQASLAQPDFTNECLQANTRGVQTLFLAMDPNSINRISHSCAAQGFHPHYSTASLGVGTILAGNTDLVGLSAPQATFPWMLSSGPASEYQEALKTYAPNLASTPTNSEVWVAGVLAQRAAKFLGAKPTSADFLKGLWDIKNDNLGGLAPPLTFTKGKPAPDFRCYFVVQMDKTAHWTAPQGMNTSC